MLTTQVFKAKSITLPPPATPGSEIHPLPSGQDTLSHTFISPLHLCCYFCLSPSLGSCVHFLFSAPLPLPSPSCPVHGCRHSNCSFCLFSLHFVLLAAVNILLSLKSDLDRLASHCPRKISGLAPACLPSLYCRLFLLSVSSHTVRFPGPWNPQLLHTHPSLLPGTPPPL